MVISAIPARGSKSLCIVFLRDLRPWRLVMAHKPDIRRIPQDKEKKHRPRRGEYGVLS